MHDIIEVEKRLIGAMLATSAYLRQTCTESRGLSMSILPDSVSNDNPYTVYSLIDPRDQSIRYIGITYDVYQRMRQHSRCEGTNQAKNAWIQELQQEQLMFIMHSIEKVATFEQALERESYWIQHYLSQSVLLLNIMGVPEDTAKPRIKQYKASKIDTKNFFFRNGNGDVVNAHDATDEEFDEFIRRYVRVVDDEKYSGWQNDQRRRFIAHALNSGAKVDVYESAIEGK